MNRDYRQELTDKIIKSMEESRGLDWEMPWKKIAVGHPENPLSGAKYNGMNRLILTMEASDKGLPNKWVTFKQAGKEGFKIKKGEKGIALEKWGTYDFWRTEKGKELKIGGNNKAQDINFVSDINVQLKNGKTLNKDDMILTDENGKQYSFRDAEREFNIPYIKTFTVFNAIQLENAPGQWLENPLKDLKEPEKIEKAEDIITAMEKDGVKFEYGGNKASYFLLTDTVHMPDRRQFEEKENFYGTVLHEIGHSTGHPKRLNREFGHYGDEKYAKEELRAELASYFLAAETGIKFNSGNTAIYLNSWIKALKEDKNEIFKAAKDASAEVDYCLSKVKDLNIANKNELQEPKTPGKDKEIVRDAFAEDLERRLNKSRGKGFGR